MNNIAPFSFLIFENWTGSDAIGHDPAVVLKEDGVTLFDKPQRVFHKSLILDLCKHPKAFTLRA